MSYFRTPTCLGILLLSLALHAGATDVSPQATVTVQGDLREFFLLTDPGSDVPAGVMALRRTAVMGGMLLEQDLCYPDGVRVFESERLRGAGRRFIWREWGHPTRTGRTWILEGERGATNLNLMSWVGGPVQRLNLAVSDGTLFPLEALERMRSIEAGTLRLELLSPLRACVESVTLSCKGVVPEPQNVNGPQRVLSMTNGRGGKVGQWTFAGKRLIGQRWPSGRRARIVDEERYHALFGVWSRLSVGSQP
jgi:hypothetical protein